MERGSPASRDSEASWAMGSTRRSPSSSRRPTPANASQVRSSWVTMDGSRHRFSRRPSRPASRRRATTSFSPAPTATPTIGMLVRELGAAGGIQISASHNPREYNGLKFFQPAGMVLSQSQGRAMLDRWQRREFRWAGWDRLGRARTIEDPDQGHLAAVLGIVDADGDRALWVQGGPRRLPRCRGTAGCGLAPGPRAAGPWSWAGKPTAVTITRPSRPRPI